MIEGSAKVIATAVLLLCGAVAAGGGQDGPEVLELWARGEPAFGVFVPDERPRESGARGRGQRPPALYTEAGGERLASNPLYDFVFLNLEGGYDAAAVRAIVNGIRSVPAGARKAVLVRIPSIERDGPDAARQRVAEVLEAGADGVVFPHVRNPEEAAQAVAFIRQAGRVPWSAADPSGDTIAMIMIEDPASLALVGETAEIDGISVLACGIGSLRGALGGDREAAEAGTLEVLAHATRVGAADMITANADDVEARIEQGFLALLMQGAEADEAIRVGRRAAGR